MTFNFKPGDRITYSPSVLHQDVTVTAVGENWFLGRRSGRSQEEAFLKVPDSGILWKAWQEPQKTWEITTERRIPLAGERYIRGVEIYVTSSWVISPPGPKDVIVKIKEVS